MAKPTIDDAVLALERIAEAVTELGVAAVAEKAALPERLVRKFVRDIMASKNADIRKITNAVRELSDEEK